MQIKLLFPPLLYWSWPRNHCTFRSQWSPWQVTWAGTSLCCTSQPAWPSGLCGAQGPWLQDNLGHTIATEESAGRSHLVPVLHHLPGHPAAEQLPAKLSLISSHFKKDTNSLYHSPKISPSIPPSNGSSKIKTRVLIFFFASRIGTWATTSL